MKGTRRTLAMLAGLAALTLFAAPAAAQSSTTSGLINELNGKLLAIAIPVTLVTEIALVYAVLKFKDSDEAEPTQENRRLEITWTVATAIILLFVGVASYGVLAQPSVTYTQDMEGPSEDDIVVNAEAYQWGWEMSYPEAGNFSTGNEIVIPQGQEVYFRVSSRDVIHGFAVPELGLKQDALPDQVNVVKTTATDTGTYQGYCTEYCGVSHSQMYFTVEVVSEEKYQTWLDEQQSDDSEGASSSLDASHVAAAGA
ncbi:MAG: cytochrome c oxidase subunit II [Halolamina sp.]